MLSLIAETSGKKIIERLKSFFATMLLVSYPINVSGYSEDDSAEILHDASNLSSSFNELLSRSLPPIAFSLSISNQCCPTSIRSKTNLAARRASNF